MRIAALILLFGAVSAAAAADPFHEPFPMPWPGAHLDAAYAQGNGEALAFDWYRPPQVPLTTRLPAIIFVNTFAERSQRGHPIYRGWARAAMAHEMVAILPDAAADFGTGFDALLEHLRVHASELGIDAARIGVYAASSHVQQGLPAMADPRRQMVRAAAFYYGYSDSVVFRSDLPVLLVRAGLDRPAMGTRINRMVAAALQANAPLTLINLPTAHHGFEWLDADAVSREAAGRTLEWMKTVLDPAYQASLRARLPLGEAAAAMERGDAERVAALYAPLVEASPADAHLRLSLAEALLAAGRVKEARAHFERLRGAGLGPRDLGLPAARAAAADGDPEAAVAWLETIPRHFRPASLATDPAFEALRTRDDFRSLFE